MTLTVHTFAVVEGQEWIFPADESHFGMFDAMDGRAFTDWDPPLMAIDREGRTYSDFPWLGEHVPILRKPAVEALGDVLLQHGQLLPVRGEDVWLFNATAVRDALDHARSRIVYFGDGSILAIERHVFDATRIAAAEVFKLPMRASPVYVTDHFVERVRRAGLRGVAFRAVWSAV
ncbi:hypothetical protein FHP25_12125 [Vineibacter terrae]|uniref:Immunity MXAN-0049 protein domain-containing protein n=1 Tax=Vineibacter terrae TaxID=2586908 RepID=A0A5C8PPB7_9HYPH|nr:DUF1629 domain-containing protein [Vineibacter terrae]TXL76388.1 hypothetical protein FHP25_12125 [Vineibacter terrae]